MRRLATLLALLAAPAGAQTAEAFLDQARADCASLDKGEFFAAPDAVARIDLTGDNQPDAIVDTAKFICSTSASYWGGTAGTWLAIMADGQQIDLWAHGWQVIRWSGHPVLLLWQNGSECGGAGADPCVQALVWSKYQGRFMTVAAP